MDESEMSENPYANNNDGQSDGLRSPRKMMFQNLPTPNQPTFQSIGYPPNYDPNDTGMIPMRPAYAADYQMAPQGEGGFGSLNDALRSPGIPPSRDGRVRKRESSMANAMSMAGVGQHVPKKSSLSRMREDTQDQQQYGTSF
jgi:RalA-binding protein 1